MTGRRSLIAWFAANPVAANLLMALILVGGALSLTTIDQQVFPSLSPRQFKVLSYYPGAGPAEIEQSLCIRIEEAIFSLPGVARLVSTAAEGSCEVLIDVAADHEQSVVMNGVRSRVLAIPNLPKGLEKTELLPEKRSDDGVIWVALHGPASAVAIRELGLEIQADLSRIPGVTKAHNYNDVPLELAVEVDAGRLRHLRWSIPELAGSLRQAAVDVPGGILKQPSGERVLRAGPKPVTAEQLRSLPILTRPDGSRVLLQDIAEVRLDLEQQGSVWRHNGETAQGWEIHADHNTVEVARRVKDYVAGMRARLPAGVEMITWWDDSQAYDERIRTLVEDGIGGFALVCLVLSLFLRLRVAFWAGAGILTSLFGALWLMPMLDVSLNMLSLFGFLLAMGILVDDAIIIGEAIHTRQQDLTTTPNAALRAAIAGVREVAVPVVLAVLVALVAFLPGLFLSGWFGKMMRPICLVLILTLVFSLVEALLILPAHLAVPARARTATSPLQGLRRRLNGGLDRFVARVYQPLLEFALRWRYPTVLGFLVLIVWSSMLVGTGHLKRSLQADVTKDTFWVTARLPADAAADAPAALMNRIEQALFRTRDTFDHRLGLDQAGADPRLGRSVLVGEETMTWEHDGGLWTEFSPIARQRVSVEDFVAEWRREIGAVGRAKIDFVYKEGDLPYDLEFDLALPDPARLGPAVAEFKRRLAGYPGVYDVADSLETGKPELRIEPTPAAERLGLRREDLLAQVRAAYFGAEVDRFHRGHGEVKIVVRLPREQREAADDLLDFPIKLPNGEMAPLRALADVQQTPGPDKLLRKDRRRVVTVQARVDPRHGDADAIYRTIETSLLPALEKDFQGVSIRVGQERSEQETSLNELMRNTGIALVVIYALIAVPFRSYLKPLIFLLAAPIAWCGAVWAHWFAGLPLSMESLVGMIAASGVVVNDSLVLLDQVGADAAITADARLIDACTRRFRPILLAFLTNFAGFFPTLLESSEQAQFLIPMTLSLSAGLALGMTASLLLTPACWSILESWTGRQTRD